MLIEGTITKTEHYKIDAHPNEVAKALRKHVFTKVFGTGQYLFLSKKNQVMCYDEYEDIQTFLAEPTEEEIAVLKAFETYL